MFIAGIQKEILNNENKLEYKPVDVNNIDAIFSSASYDSSKVPQIDPKASLNTVNTKYDS
jgi:hypothetical protein